jgi:hypothetical protein
MGRSGESRRSSRRAGERGAAVVEFALVVPILLGLVFGVMDYGFWFNESLNVRQGVREAARQGVVRNYDHPACTGSDAAKLVCKTKHLIAPTAGQAYARVVVPAAGWKHGEPLLVCGMVRVDGVTGMVPLPEDRLVKSRASMSIEQDTPATITAGSYGDVDPSGAAWAWCS